MEYFTYSMIKVLKAERQGRKIICVVPEDGGGWGVRKQGALLSTVICESKQRAITIAKNIAKKHLPCRVQICRRDGRIQEELLYKKADFFEDGSKTSLAF